MKQPDAVPGFPKAGPLPGRLNLSGWMQAIQAWFLHTFNTRKKRMVLLQVSIMILAALLRIGAAHTRSIVYSENSYFDEYQMLEQSRLDEYFKAENENERSMIKTLTFPWFLNLCRTLHIPLNTMMGLLWIASALCTWSMMRKWTASRWNCLFAYLFVLFCPIGFENNNGVHLYRSLILAPFLFIFFALLIWLMLDCWKKPGRPFAWIWPILGLCCIYPAAYYIKEDGFWLTPVLYAFLFLAAVGLARSIGHRWLSLFKGVLIGACLLLPLASFHIQTERYLDANEKTFGYRGITVRTEGPIQEYASMVYQIQSKERTMHQWAPQDAVQPTIDASLTLQAMPDFVDALRQISWGNGALLGGDFLPWRIWQAWSLTDHYSQPGNIRTIIPVFEKVCQEVEAAFEDGRIEKQTGRFQISSRAGSRSLAEVLNIFPDLLLAFDEAITLKDYNPTPPSPVNEEQEFLASFQEELGIDLRAPQNEQEEAAWNKRKEASKLVAQTDFALYRIIIPVLFWGGLVCWGYEIYLYVARWILKRKNNPSRNTPESQSRSVFGSGGRFPFSKSKKRPAAKSVFGGAAAGLGHESLEKKQEQTKAMEQSNAVSQNEEMPQNEALLSDNPVPSSQANGLDQPGPYEKAVLSGLTGLEFKAPDFQSAPVQSSDSETSGLEDPGHSAVMNTAGLENFQPKAGWTSWWSALREKMRASKSTGRRVPEGLVLFLVFVLVGLSAAYEFGILWFLQFLYYLPQYAYQHIYWILYYSSGMLPMLYLALLLMIPFELRRLRQMRRTLFSGS